MSQSTKKPKKHPHLYKDLFTQEELFKFEHPTMRWIIFFTILLAPIIPVLILWNYPIASDPNENMTYGKLLGAFFLTIWIMWQFDMPLKRTKLTIGEIGFITIFGYPLMTLRNPGFKLLAPLMFITVAPIDVLEDPDNAGDKNISDFLTERGMSLTGGMGFIIKASFAGDKDAEDELKKPQEAIVVCVARYRLAPLFLIRFFRFVGGLFKLRSMTAETVMQSVQNEAGSSTVFSFRENLNQIGQKIQKDIERKIKEPYHNTTIDEWEVPKDSWCVFLVSFTVSIFPVKDIIDAQNLRAAQVAKSDAKKIEGDGEAYYTKVTQEALKNVEGYEIEVILKALGIADDQGKIRDGKEAEAQAVFAILKNTEAIKDNSKFFFAQENILNMMQQMANLKLTKP